MEAATYAISLEAAGTAEMIHTCCSNLQFLVCGEGEEGRCKTLLRPVRDVREDRPGLSTGPKALCQKLSGVNDEVGRYNTVLKRFADAGDDEWEAIVAASRGELQKPFFEHLQCLVIAAKEDKAKCEKLVLLNTRLLALITNHDSIEADEDKLMAASEVYRGLLTSISSIEDADKKMAELSKAGKIDPAFLQITAKAYGAARDTNMTKVWRHTTPRALWRRGQARGRGLAPPKQGTHGHAKVHQRGGQGRGTHGHVQASQRVGRGRGTHGRAQMSDLFKSDRMSDLFKSDRMSDLFKSDRMKA
eukprot:364556-Chlamydomonas_euryale.AAC.6